MAALVALLVLLPQEPAPADPIPALLDRLRSGNPETVERAQEEMAALDPVILDRLRPLVARESAEVAARLKEIIARIERRKRIAEIVGSAPRVTLHADRRPVREIAEEMSRQTGYPVTAPDLPASEVATVRWERVVLWKAVEDLCRSAGRVMYEYHLMGVRLLPEPYRELPRIHHENHLIVLTRLTRSRSRHGEYQHVGFWGDAMVVGISTRNRLPAMLSITEIQDDTGRSYRKGKGPLDYQGALNPRFRFGSSSHPPPQARTLQLKGSVTMRLNLQDRMLVRTQVDPLRESVGQKEDWSLVVHSIQMREGSAWASVTIDWPAPTDSGRLDVGAERSVVAILSDGTVVPGTLGIDAISRIDPGRQSSRGAFRFPLTPEQAVAALEVREPADVVEIPLPFAFEGLPIP